MSVYGVKLHLICCTDRVPLSYELTAANVAEVSLTKELLEGANLGEDVARRLFGELAYLSEALKKALAGVERATNNLDAMISDARPGIQNFSKSTLPEANRMIRDLRELSESLRGLTERVEQGGVGSALGAPKLPDYKPRDGQ